MMHRRRRGLTLRLVFVVHAATGCKEDADPVVQPGGADVADASDGTGEVDPIADVPDIGETSGGDPDSEELPDVIPDGVNLPDANDGGLDDAPDIDDPADEGPGVDSDGGPPDVGPDGLDVPITVEPGLRVTDPAARACDVLLLESTPVVLAGVGFAAGVDGESFARSPRWGLSFARSADSAFEGKSVLFSFTSPGYGLADLEIGSATCYGALGAPLPGATVVLE